MLKKLSLSNGISGFEENIIDLIIPKIKPYADKVFKDSFGNLYAFKKGDNPKKTIAVVSHTDEVGLIISDITDEGYLKFRTVGGIDSMVLLGKRVLVGEKMLPGVIGSRAVHLLSNEERKEKIS
ncbi:MAG: M42 family peptidase, partial [Clostridia bacterium]|nr:M42 family peptidase [Clostridia bacterium]